MARDINEQALIKFQDFLSSKPILLIGTGLSISMGLPGMKELNDYLKVEMPICCSSEQNLLDEWLGSANLIEKHGLEDGLSKIDISSALLNQIVFKTAELVEGKDTEFRNHFFSNSDHAFPLAKLIKHLLDSRHPNESTLEVITSNYDHLIEYACDHINVTCCTGFQGNYLQRYTDTNLRSTPYTASASIKPRVSYRQTKQVRLYKPHGSLRWQLVNDEVVQCVEALPINSRVIITPGITKYAASMTSAVMNSHREFANDSIRKAPSMLIIGYGFNDSHLQTQLFASIKQGMRCLVLTHRLSENAKQLINGNPHVMGLEAAEEGCTLFYHNGSTEILPSNLWNLGDFTDKVIG